MKDPKNMTDIQLWGWIEKSCTTCHNIVYSYADYEKACYSDAFLNARERFELCAEEFDKRGLKTKDFDPLIDYNEVEDGYFFTDSLA